MIIGIDATNIRAGGGVTHLLELVKCVRPEIHNTARVIVFAPELTLNQLPKYDWLEEYSDKLLNKNALTRLFWQQFLMPKISRKKNVDILLSLGGTFIGDFHPYVSMSQNMLVFDEKERNRYGFSLTYLRLQILELLQSLSFKKSDGVLYISKYAQQQISKKGINKTFAVIPHGISERFKQKPKFSKPIEQYSSQNPFKILYVSIVDVYKHQWNVVRAVEKLRYEDNLPIELHLVGPHYPPAYKILLNTIEKVKDSSSFIFVHGKVPFKEIEVFYKSADLFVFASTCENMPNIVIEAMSAALPICSSDTMPMPEFLKDAAIYFNAEDYNSIYSSLIKLIESTSLRDELSKKASAEATQYSWERNVKETVKYLKDISEDYKKNS